MRAGCAEIVIRLLDYQRGLLAAKEHEVVRRRLDECPDCAREDAAEQGLGEALERRLPQYPAPVGLKRRLARQWAIPAPPRPARPRALGPAVVAAGLAAALVLLVVLVRPGGPPTLVDGVSVVALEAVNNHLRILEPARRLDVPSDEMHQVRPWFAGRVDFAPVVRFGGDADFPLKGGAIERFLDRRAAVFVYGRRLHTISLLVFRADDGPGSSGWGLRPEPVSLTVRGFNVLQWRERDLGYVLVSDLNADELRTLGARLAAP